MTQNKERDDSNKIAVLSVRDLKTSADFPAHYNLKKSIDNVEKQKYSLWNFPGAATFSHYTCLFILGLIIWGLLWIAFGDSWRWDGPWFRMAAVGVVAWASGRLLNGLTTLPPLLAALLIGILARHFEVLDMREFMHIDAFLRKIYPVLILGKGSLAWDLNYMKANSKRVAALGVLPWCTEVLVMSICTHQLLGFPWIWGILLGSIFASVSCPVIMPSVARIGMKGGRNWPQIVCTAGGTETALSVGVYGCVLSYIFSDSGDTYRYTKLALAIVAGVALGIIWGSVSGLIPHSKDYYVTEMRVLFVLLGGLLGFFGTAHLGWGGTGGVAVLACNATAATYWKRDGWKLNNNAASTVYRVLWAATEPLVFAYTGTYVVIDTWTANTLLYGLLILFICLTVRLTVAFLVCWGSWEMSLKERIFVCCVWTPKSIVEAVLCPVAITTAISAQASPQEVGYAEDILKLLVLAIIITTPIGFLLTHYIGPWLLAEKADVENVSATARRKMSGLSNGSRNEDLRL
ncbi:hypothetical protein O0L34_g1157 [Tuta absoluta]|nr:hypothetical protein O0L34_g1157 [Tuta absoluta]